MKQAKDTDPLKHPARHGWPSAVRLAIPFTPADDHPSGLAVHFLDYAIFTVLQVTLTADTPLTVSDLLVNGEFRPAFVTGSLSDQFLPLRLPMQMNRGTSFGAVLRAPAATIVPLDCCYPKAPASLAVTTNRGTFTFQAGEPIPNAVSPA